MDGGAWISDLSRSGTFAYLVTGTPLIMLCFKWVFVRFLHLKDPTLNKIAGSQRQQKQILGPIEDQNSVITIWVHIIIMYQFIVLGLNSSWVLITFRRFCSCLNFFVEQICTFFLQFIIRKKKSFYAKVGYKKCAHHDASREQFANSNVQHSLARFVLLLLCYSSFHTKSISQL